MIDRDKLQTELFQEGLDGVYRRRDRVFAYLMLAQWVAGVLVALIYSPVGWEGKVQTTHLHVWYALVVGGALSGSSIVLALSRPGWVVTRHWIAISQMLWSALLIHLTGGRIETHFHVFGSLAFLAFYRDWRVLITATLTVASEHLTRGLMWPESVYGITNPEWWRFLEHAFWVAFEDVVLVMGILESLREMRVLAARQTDLEERVEGRTREVVAAKREVSEILDNMRQAIFTVGREGKINRAFSAHCANLFGSDQIAGRTASDLLQVELEGWASTVIGADRHQWALCESDPPAEVHLGDRIIEITYVAIYQGDLVDRVMFVCRDVTELRRLGEDVHRKEEENRSILERVAQVGALDPVLLAAFLEEADAQIEVARAAMVQPDLVESMPDALRALHTLKGNARAYGLSALAYAAHATEQGLQQIHERETSADERSRIKAEVENVAMLVGQFNRLATEILGQRNGFADRERLAPLVENARLLAEDRDHGLATLQPEHRERVERLLSGVIELPLVPFSALLPRLEAVVTDVAARVGKPTPHLKTSLGTMLLDPPVLEKLSGVLTQLMRNAIDHGIEQPLERLDAHKKERGRLSLDAAVAGDRLQLVVHDDGCGIDLDRIREVALGRRLISETHHAMFDDEAALELLFTPGFSTNSIVTEISGRGVGLDVVRTAIRDLGGEVGVRSDAGQGTTFMLTLPKSCATMPRVS